MHRLSIHTIKAFLLVLIIASTAAGSNPFPLEPPDTTSPRATLVSFLYYSEAFHKAMRTPGTNPLDQAEALQRAVQCFDLSEVPPTLVKSVGVESVLRLREILDRIVMPDTREAPDARSMEIQKIETWRIPLTEITIGKTKVKNRFGSFLFTPETVDSLDDYYNEIRHLPYRDGAVQGIYEEYLYSSGWLIPDGFIKKLPEWMKVGYHGQALWQWFGLVLTIILGFIALCPLLAWHKNLKKKESTSTWRVSRLIFPLSAMGLSLFVEYFINTQINITGKVLTITVLGLEAVFFFFSAWAIMVGGNVATHGIITSQKIKQEALNADVIRLICRLVSFSLVFALFYRAGRYFGLPVAAVFASASIAGVAVALAARETLANFFGGVSIFLDRPFKAGDYIVLDTGERGEVKTIGIRSTRLQTRDDILITIPNSLITTVKITNQSAPNQHFRVPIKVSVAYGSKVEDIEKTLMDIALGNTMVMKTPAPRVRLRNLGDSSLNFELLVWASSPSERGRVIHELNKQIYARFNEAGITIPFPQQDIHIRSEDNKKDKSHPAKHI
ncbi:MAG: mechanosensitive ion channel family protein [Pseudodesulfovibrio sp.]|nr:mechanosensitive ion channel family protein [Pseudodesulfovibrio sp.]